MDDLMKKALQTVENINREIYEILGDTDFYCNIELITNGDGISIKFGEYCLWCSSDDERPWHEGGDIPIGQEYQDPLEDFVRKELKDFLKVLRKLEII